MTDPTPEQVLELIRNGRIPIEDVLVAVRGLVESTESSIEWVLDLGKIPTLNLDGELTADSMTVGEQYAVTNETGAGWDGIHPMLDVRIARSIVRQALITRKVDPDLIDQVPVGVLTAAIHERERQQTPDPS